MSRLLAPLLVAAATSVAVAGPTPPTPPGDAAKAAAKLFDDGRALAKSGDYVAACDRFTRSLELDPSALGTELNLADCLEHRAQTAKAWHLFDDVARVASAAGDDVKRRFARDRADKLVVQLVSVVVHVPADRPAGTTLTIGGAPIDLPRGGGDIHDYADPGTTAIVVSVPGKPELRFDKRGAAGGTIDLEIELPVETVEAHPPHHDGGDAHPRRASWVHGAYLVGGIGAATAIGAAVFAILARNAHQDALASGCFATDQGLMCTGEGASHERDAGTLADTATGLSIAAAVLVGAGVITYIAAPREPSHRVVLVPVAGPHEIGLAVGGHF